MAYGSVSGVRALTGVEETTEWDERIASWLAESDAKIEKRLGRTFSDPVPSLITRLSNLLTAITVLERLKAEGTVSDVRIGDVWIDSVEAIGETIRGYQREAEEIFRLYESPIVKSSKYEYIEEDES